MSEAQASIDMMTDASTRFEREFPDLFAPLTAERKQTRAAAVLEAVNVSSGRVTQGEAQ